MTEKLTLISAKQGSTPCVHGSIFCRRCYGEQINHPDKVRGEKNQPKKKK